MSEKWMFALWREGIPAEEFGQHMIVSDSQTPALPAGYTHYLLLGRFTRSSEKTGTALDDHGD